MACFMQGETYVWWQLGQDKDQLGVISTLFERQCQTS